MPIKRIWICATTFLVVTAIALASHFAIAQENPPTQRTGTRVERAKLEFTKVNGHIPDFTIYRAKIPGGWLVTDKPGPNGGKGMTFVPDPDHKWNGGSVD